MTMSEQQGDLPRRLAAREADLLERINSSLAHVDWERYHALIARRRAETLTTEEQSELIAISDRIEVANVARIEHLAELARLRGTTVDALIDELGLQLRAHA